MTKDKEIRKFASLFEKDIILEELEQRCKGDERYLASFMTVKDLTTDPELSGYYDREEMHEQEKISIREYALEEGAKTNAIGIAKNLLKYGMNIKDIAKNVNLTVQKIKQIQMEQE